MRTEADVLDSIKEHFSGILDPRVAGRTLDPLMEVLVMAFVGVLCGGDDWEGSRRLPRSTSLGCVGS